MTEARRSALTGVGAASSRAAREARGLALADVAQQLKFAPRQLEALEAERFDALPGAHLRARHGAQLRAPAQARSRAAARSASPAASTRRTPTSLAARYQPAGAVLRRRAARRPSSTSALSLGVLALVGGGRLRVAAASAARPPRPRRKADRRRRKAAPREAGAAPRRRWRRRRSRRAAPRRGRAAKPVASAEAAPRAGEARAGRSRAVADRAAAPARRRAPHRAALRDGEAWVEITDAAGRMLLSRSTRRAASAWCAARPPFSLVIGNASHVRVTLQRPPVDLAAAHQGRRRALHRCHEPAMRRRISRQVAVGDVRIGGGAPIVVQSMTNTDTADAAATARQVAALARAGSELVRITVNTPEAAAQVPRHPRAARRDGLRRAAGRRLPLQRPQAAHAVSRTAREALAKYRINPGNVGKGAKRDEQFATMIECAHALRQAGAHRRQLGQPRPGAARAHDGRERAARRSRWTPTR